MLLGFQLIEKGELIHLTSEEDDAKIVLNLKTGESLGTESLAFDHSQIIKAFNRVCNKMYHEPQVLRVLGDTLLLQKQEKFTLSF